MNLEFAPKAQKREKKVAEALGEDHDIVVALRKIETAKRRLTYRHFAAIAFASGEANGPKFHPGLFGLLNRLPGGLDALVVKDSGECPDRHAQATCNIEGWEVAEDAEVAAIVG